VVNIFLEEQRDSSTLLREESMKKIAAVFLTLVCFIIGLAQAQSGTLVFARDTEPDTLDQTLSAGGQLSLDIIQWLGGTLVTIDPETGEYIPYLAESWEVSDDGLNWTFKLKQNVKFHNGDPVTAKDWVYTIERAKTEEAQSGLAAFMLGPITKAEAVDDYTLRFTLEQPFAPLLFNLAVYTSQPLSQRAIEEAGADYGRNPVGAGPFVFKEWTTGNRVVLERNPDFAWGPAFANGAPNIQTIEFRTIPEPATVLAGLMAGEIDAARIPAKDAERLRDSGNFQVFQATQTGIPNYVYLSQKGVFEDVRVRQALNYAVDREGLVKIAVQGNGQAQYGPLTPSDIGYSQAAHDTAYQFDLEKAKALMTEAGYSDSDGDGILEKDGQSLAYDLLVDSTSPEQVRIAEVLKEQYKALGFDLQVSPNEIGAIIDPICVTAMADLAVFGMSFGDVDLLSQFNSSLNGGGCVGNVNDPELDEMLGRTRTSTTTEERMTAADEVQRRIIEQAYIVPLFAGFDTLVVSNRAKDVIFNPYADARFGLLWFNASLE
jgi:peptide/nickel transport system substrate-binding protein